MPDRTTFIRHLDEALGDDPRIALAAVRQLIATDLPWLELRAVRHARSHGYEWARVGRLLGRSRQAVRAKYKSDRPVRFELANDEQRLRRILADIKADEARRADLEAWEQQTDVVPW